MYKNSLKKQYFGVYQLTNTSPVTIWLFLELWDFIYYVGVSRRRRSIGVGVLSYDLTR